jgi:hypothetical protein
VGGVLVKQSATKKKMQNLTSSLVLENRETIVLLEGKRVYVYAKQKLKGNKLKKVYVQTGIW